MAPTPLILFGKIKPCILRFWLLEYGALDGPDAHAVVGLVLGAFGELSISC
jgi:hypothetical protein